MECINLTQILLFAFLGFCIWFIFIRNNNAEKLAEWEFNYMREEYQKRQSKGLSKVSKKKKKKKVK